MAFDITGLPQVNFDINISAGGLVNVFIGGSFEPKPVKYWSGSGFITKPLKFWNGSIWQET